MQFTLVAVGRMQRGPELELVQQYLARLPWQSEIIEIDIKKQSANTAERKKREAERILANIKPGALLIALDENGKNLTSRQFAGKLDTWLAEGRNHIYCVIGGADGLDPEVLAKADLKLALGQLTWPHMMVRAMIVEQMYRAWAINSGHPYHRD